MRKYLLTLLQRRCQYQKTVSANITKNSLTHPPLAGTRRQEKDKGES